MSSDQTNIIGLKERRLKNEKKALLAHNEFDIQEISTDIYTAILPIYDKQYRIKFTVPIDYPMHHISQITFIDPVNEIYKGDIKIDRNAHCVSPALTLNMLMEHIQKYIKYVIDNINNYKGCTTISYDNTQKAKMKKCNMLLCDCVYLP